MGALGIHSSLFLASFFSVSRVCQGKVYSSVSGQLVKIYLVILHLVHSIGLVYLPHAVTTALLNEIRL
jgi:hypothetical protein